MASKINLKWQNRFSREEGYVKSVSPKNGYFINTFDKEEAKKYPNQASVERDLAFLNSIGEMDQNAFFMEPYN